MPKRRLPFLNKSEMTRQTRTRDKLLLAHVLRTNGIGPKCNKAYACHLSKCVPYIRMHAAIYWTILHTSQLNPIWYRSLQTQKNWGYHKQCDVFSLASCARSKNTFRVVAFVFFVFYLCQICSHFILIYGRGGQDCVQYWFNCGARE